MDKIFDVLDKSGRRIHLSREKWRHISSKHSKMVDTQMLEEIKDTLINPALIVEHKYDETKRNYYKHYKDKQRYLLVVVKYLNGDGYISTAFMTRRIIKR